MNYRSDYDYHVMNNYSGKLVYSTDVQQDAEVKAQKYSLDSGYSHTVLQAVKSFRVKRVIEEVEE